MICGCHITNLGTKCSRGLTNSNEVMRSCITAGSEVKGGSLLTTRDDGPADCFLGRPLEYFRFLGRPRALLSVSTCECDRIGRVCAWIIIIIIIIIIIKRIIN